ncbi:hypothetical protein LUW77_14005 [Streptomyces radiopugnans]|nr:hypothetical protein LUW77_14005 [Streptomyces radiopugnans]
MPKPGGWRGSGLRRRAARAGGIRRRRPRRRRRRRAQNRPRPGPPGRRRPDRRRDPADSDDLVDADTPDDPAYGSPYGAGDGPVPPYGVSHRTPTKPRGLPRGTHRTPHDSTDHHPDPAPEVLP